MDFVASGLGVLLSAARGHFANGIRQLLVFLNIWLHDLLRHLALVVEDVRLYRVDVPVHQFLVPDLRQRVVMLEIDHLFFNFVQLLRFLLKLRLECCQFCHVVVVHFGVGSLVQLRLVHFDARALSLSGFDGGRLLQHMLLRRLIICKLIVVVLILRQFVNKFELGVFHSLLSRLSFLVWTLLP